MSSQARRLEKVNGVLTAVHDNNWRSLNEFLLAFYTSDDPDISRKANRSIAYKEGQEYAPENFLDAWLKNTHGDSQRHLERVITQKVAHIMVGETNRAIQDDSLRISSGGINIPRLTVHSGLSTLAGIYQRLLPCLWLLLYTVLMAPNTSERKHHRTNASKDEHALRAIVVMISMLLFVRNRATDAFQIIMGLFLSSTGCSRRVIDTLNHMGLSVSYVTVQRCLVTLSDSARERARNFVRTSGQLFGIVYDNINFTLRKASQRLDSTTEQLNATTSALFSLPAKFTRAVYASALSISQRAAQSGKRDAMTLDSLKPSPEKQAQLIAAFRYHVRTILLAHAPGLSRRTKANKKLRKAARSTKPIIRQLGSEKTQFYPLPALAQEEASVGGTIKVVTQLFTRILGLAQEVVDAELRLLVGDWLTIRNLRLMKAEVMDERSTFRRMSWVQESAMPFHFQLNAMYMLFRTHLGYPGDNDPSSLNHHRALLRCSKLDPKKPEYNKAKELLCHSLIARVIDCTRVVLGHKTAHDLRKWRPEWEEFDRVVCDVVERFAGTNAAHNALAAGDEVLGHAILFIRDALTFYEFSDAVRNADVGRMWLVYDFWVFMMRGAGCHNYGNEILEMKAQFLHEFTPELREVIENTWLVNRWGIPGKSIPTDLYLEHNNGFIKNMFAAMGSNASMEHITTKASAPVEALRTLAHDVATYFGMADFHRGHHEVSVDGDILALLLDLQTQNVHSFKSDRRIPPPTKPKAHPTRGKARQTATTSIRDILLEGLQGLTHRRLFEHWQRRSGKGGTGLYDGDGEWVEADDDRVGVDADAEPEVVATDSAFDNPDGTFEVDLALDVESGIECPTLDVPVSMADSVEI